MAIFKSVNGNKSTTVALKNCISYVLREDKTEKQLSFVSGPWNADVSVSKEDVYRCFLNEQKIWSKESGRLYLHSIVSFHREE